MSNQPDVFYDFHVHTSFREGTLIPSELAQRLWVMGCAGVAMTDHVDCSNLGPALDCVLSFVEQYQDAWPMAIIPGVELTHVPPAKIEALTQRARAAGARWVVVHGETLSEPVAPGTNRAAIEAGVDLVAHPGLITDQEAELAAASGVYLEISMRKGHCLANGWVAARARQAGAKLLLDSDTHSSADIVGAGPRRRIAQGAGLSPREVEQVWTDSAQVIKRLGPPV